MARQSDMKCSVFRHMKAFCSGYDLKPEVMNAIDDEVPAALSAAVREADSDPDVHIMVLSGNGSAAPTLRCALI